MTYRLTVTLQNNDDELQVIYTGLEFPQLSNKLEALEELGVGYYASVAVEV